MRLRPWLYNHHRVTCMHVTLWYHSFIGATLHSFCNTNFHFFFLSPLVLCSSQIILMTNTFFHAYILIKHRYPLNLRSRVTGGGGEGAEDGGVVKFGTPFILFFQWSLLISFKSYINKHSILDTKIKYKNTQSVKTKLKSFILQCLLQ